MMPNRFLIYQFTFWISGIVFTWPMERREDFGKRFVGVTTGALGLTGAHFFLWTQGILGTELPVKAIPYVLLVLFLYVCWDISLSVAMYNMVWGVCVWQILEELSAVVVVIQERMGVPYAVGSIGILLLYVIGYVSPALTIAKWMPKGRKKKMGPRQIGLTLLIFLLVNVLTFNERLQENIVLDSEWKYLCLAQIVCIVLLYLEGEMFKKSVLRQELEVMNLLYRKEQEQYHLAKENIALINQKCHDLKHQIRALRNADKAELDRYLKEIENSVEIYEAIVKTGNDVFDTILTEKSLYCKDRQIQVSCVADGSQMDFIDTIDLYAILGNAMDNAIEAVEKFREPEKRQIDVIIYRQQKFLVINIINPISETLTYEEGLPVTTKGDKQFHGFGLRSMKHIIKKYEGYMSVAEEDGCFSLKLLIPIPTAEKTTT